MGLRPTGERYPQQGASKIGSGNVREARGRLCSDDKEWKRHRKGPNSCWDSVARIYLLSNLESSVGLTLLSLLETDSGKRCLVSVTVSV